MGKSVRIFYFSTWHLSFIVVASEHARRPFPAFGAHRQGRDSECNVGKSLAGWWKSWESAKLHAYTFTGKEFNTKPGLKWQ